MKLDRTAVALACVAAGLVSLWLQNVIVPYSTPFWGLFDNQLDLDVYRQGATVVIDGGDLYRTKLLGQMDFTYAPISIGVFIPFAMMSVAVAHVIWTIGIFVALYFVVVLSFRVMGHDVTWRLRVIALSLVAVSTLLEPVRSTIWFGQINVFLMLLICADLLRPEGSRLRGVATGAAAGIKLTPMFFVVYAVALREWRTVSGIVGGFAATVLVGFAVLPRESWRFWTGTLFDTSRVASPQTVGNQSVRGALANLGDTDHPNAIAWLALSAVVAALALTAAVLAHRCGQELLAVSLVGMTSCAVSPVAWGHHWVWFVPLLVVALHHIVEGARRRRRLLLAVLTTAGFLAAFAWRTHLAYPIWYVNRSVEEAYLTGLFFKHSVPVVGWFSVQPYNIILVVVAAVTICLCAQRWRRGPAVVAVGDRR